MNKLLQIASCFVGLLLLTDAECRESDPKQLVLPQLIVQAGHSNDVTSLAFSPNGYTLASGSSDNSIKLWDIRAGKELRTLRMSSSLNTVAFSPRGKTLASASSISITIWEVGSGKVLRTIGLNEGASDVAFSPNGKVLASVNYTALKLWDVATGRCIRIMNKSERDAIGRSFNSVAFSPDGRRLVTAQAAGEEQKNDTIRMWDVSTGKELRTFIGHAGDVKAVRFSPDGRILASAGYYDYTVKLWDVSSGKELRTLSGHDSNVESLAFSPDGSTLASGSARTTKLWKVETGQELLNFEGGSVVAFSSDTHTLASASPYSSDPSSKSIKLWDIATQSGPRILDGACGEVNSVAFSPDGLTLAAGGNSMNVKLWDIAMGGAVRTLSGHDGGVDAVAFARDGRTIASLGYEHTNRSFQSIKLSNAATGRELHTSGELREGVNSMMFSPDGKLLAAGGWSSIKLWDVESFKELENLKGVDGGGNAMAFSPDGNMLASGGENGRTLPSGAEGLAFDLFDARTGKRVDTDIGNQTFIIFSLAFSPDGRALASGNDNGIKLWDVANGKTLLTFEEHSDWITGVAFSPDGKTLASSDAQGIVRLWDLTSGLVLRRFLGHRDRVNSIAFSPDGRTLATGSKDKTIRLWRVSDGALLATLYSFNDGTWVVTDPEGRFDTADLEEIKGLHWVMPDDPLTPVPLEAFMKDYYEPRLLSRILNGEKFKPVRALMDLNRVQPEVRINSIKPDSKDPERAIVEVEVIGAAKDYIRNSKEISIATAAHDLRLFRDGQLVGYVDGNIVKAGDKPYRKTFNVHLPTSMHGQDVTLSAYAFNDDRVKSATVRQTYRVPESVTAKKGNAYLISVGVNEYNNPDLTLGYAANDASSMIDTLTAKLKATHDYQQIIPIPLLSNEQHHDAGKAQLQAVLDRLAGKPVTTINTALLKELPSAGRLKPVTPDDLVILTFSGHGYADTNGNFYLLTQDAGTGNLDEQLKRSVSSEELSNWLKDIDAGDMSLIIDACHSAASIEGQGYKPGPMGSRGLGQLAFDKGLRLLAASQADEFALEHASLEHGILSFALITNGIENFEADRAPKDKKIMLDEWLHYGVDRVPTLVDEIKAGKIQMASRDVSDVKIKGAKLVQGKKRVAQQPALFDFSKKRRQVEVAVQ